LPWLAPVVIGNRERLTSAQTKACRRGRFTNSAWTKNSIGS
jgi:hypothetical protein